jgi:hypothetical protein
MFAKDVIDSMRGIVTTTKEQDQTIRNLCSTITQAEKFHFGDIRDYKGLFSADYKPFTRCGDDFHIPYPLCWFENIVPDNFMLTEKLKKMMERDRIIMGTAGAFLVEELIESSFLKIISFTRSGKDPNPRKNFRWIFMPIVYFVSLKGPFRENTEAMEYFITLNRKYWVNDIAPNFAMSPMRGFDDAISKIGTVDFSLNWKSTDIAEVFIRLLTCQNIVLEKVDNVERKRVGKKIRDIPKGYSYYVLNVKLPTTRFKKGNTGENLNEEPVMRLHLCRGHFKTYTDDAPLFGRYTGTWWWQSMVRGDKELGEVEKDYDIERSM